ncbi:MAG: hypothetical protein E6Q27_02780 [Aeromicrobium sp.]|nr:MAG: hypothetical protein E6Q27_02780 [Aeromicrobium sp.]
MMGSVISRGTIVIPIFSMLLLLAGVAPAHAAPTGKLKVTVVAPRGVAVSTAMAKSSKRIVFPKYGSASSTTVSKKVATGSWQPRLSPIKSGKSFYIPTANKKSVKVKKGKTAKIKVTYKLAAVTTNVIVTEVRQTSASVTFARPPGKPDVIIRVLPGTTAPATVSQGSAVAVVENKATATGLMPGTHYTFSAFTKVGGYWVGPVSTGVKTSSYDGPIASERQALIDLKNANSGKFNDWTGENHCAWLGVTCTDGRVTVLDVNNRQITTLPASIGNLTLVKKLYADDNFVRSVPASIGRLMNLTELNLGNNQLTSVPSELGNLGSLTRLGLSGNGLTTLPISLGNLTSLVELNLSNNSLAGDVSSWANPLRNVTSLKYLPLGGNACLHTGSNTQLAQWLDTVSASWRSGC